jgi:hypothetical protein
MQELPIRRTGAPESPKPDSTCPECGGRGWKYRTFRRSVALAGDAGEREHLTRERVPCLACTPPPKGDGDDK